MKYVAFLKAINVGGHVVKMDLLKDLFIQAKFTGVESFIASGNMIFETKATPDHKLEQKIEKHLEAALGYPVGTFVRSLDEIAAVSVHPAFSDELLKQSTVVNVGFFKVPVSEDAAAQVKAFNSDVDELHVHGREAYWLCRIRSSDSKFPAKKCEKLLGGSITWRNMNTVVRLAEKYKV